MRLSSLNLNPPRYLLLTQHQGKGFASSQTCHMRNRLKTIVLYLQ
ncbi:hypothetical protein V6Z11_D02G111800 [Gossypium hirsutum]